MKTGIVIALSLSMLSLGGFAYANGPKTPIDALQRLQGKRLLRRPTVSGTKLLLQMSASGVKGKVGKVDTKTKPKKTSGPMLQPPSTAQLLRGQKVSFCAGSQCGPSLRDAASRFGGKHTITTSRTKGSTKVETKNSSNGFFGRVLDRLSDLISGL